MGNDLTLFSTCRPFDGEFVEIQCNAIASWSLLKPKPEIILFGDEARDVARLWDCRCVPVERNEYGTPLVSAMWKKAREMASGDVLCYVNSDIVLLGDFPWAIKRVADELKTFLMVGSRWDLSERMPEVVFSKQGWQAALSLWAIKHGQRHPPNGSDYFVWRGDVWGEIPDFAAGRFWWDTWLMWKARMRAVPVVDATKCVLALHPPHERAYKGKASPEVERNKKLGKKDGSGAVKDASWVLTREELRQK